MFNSCVDVLSAEEAASFSGEAFFLVQGPSMNCLNAFKWKPSIVISEVRNGPVYFSSKVPAVLGEMFLNLTERRSW